MSGKELPLMLQAVLYSGDQVFYITHVFYIVTSKYL